MAKGRNNEELDIIGIMESVMDAKDIDPEQEPSDEDLKKIEEESDWDIIRCSCGKSFNMLGTSTQDGLFKCPKCGALHG